MNKTILASAVALALGTAGAANALTVTVTEMNFGSLYAASGTITSNGTGSFNSVDPFYGNPWTADTVGNFFQGSGSYTWNSPSSAAGPYSYNFSLTSNQVAWGTFFDWNTNLDIAVLNIMTCTSFTTGAACAGTGTPMQNGPFAGQAPAFNGTVVSSSAAVPVPAAAWLMGSGLIGLAGVARPAPAYAWRWRT